jgi:rhamnogalacturonan endolyase
MRKTNFIKGLVIAAMLFAVSSVARAQYLMEKLGRGVVAVRQNETQVYVGWRLLGTEYPTDIGFNIYRTVGSGAPEKLNGDPLTQTTDFTDTPPDFTQKLTYTVKAVVGGAEQTAAAGTYTLAAETPARQYLSVPLQIPPPFTTPDGVARPPTSTATANTRSYSSGTRTTPASPTRTPPAGAARPTSMPTS